MVVTGPAPTEPVGGRRPVSARHFVRLKLRVMGNGFRGQGWRIGLFIGGIVTGLWLATTGFLLLALPGLADSRTMAEVSASLGGGLLVLGWTLLPLVFFGVDETLDPARFALLPVGRRMLVLGMLVAALVGVPAAATLLASAGLVVTAATFGGWSAALVTAVGVVAGVVLCVAASRAVTSAFASMLRSRRVRDLAAVLLAVFAALLAPLQLFAANALGQADLGRLAGVARIVGWTPFAAPYTLGIDLALGRGWAVPPKLLITALTLGLLLWWWSRSLESAMVGTVSAAPGRAGRERPVTGAVAQLFPAIVRWLPRDRHGALVAREARYWWRDSRRRANLITLAVIGVFVPAIVNVSGQGAPGGGFDASAPLVSFSMITVGVLAAVTLANQFGFDGSAYAANVIAGVPGRVELTARVVGFSLYIVPLLLVIAVGLGLFLGEPGWIGVLVGTLFAAYGCGLAVNLFISVLGAYALPETSNPFAINTGAGMARSLLSFVAMAATGAAALPMLVATVLLGDVWLWLALPVGLGYGVAAAALGTWLAGDLVDRRMPELLVTVTPRR
ncbi:ABC transporter permease [Solwaraspora sp. WMMD1047]|uniref:ABC transporter permease n=1 Tax=Solwaraspora sp. WMMD1047 TaxID=3016102 RepID=UPI00241729C5|nr:ABC transporter permease [Solwaraspora sp. WMMD1047]MDG4827739.1 ABC transporter permease [Solwaraspora sp. WMMD1047]